MRWKAGGVWGVIVLSLLAAATVTGSAYASTVTSPAGFAAQVRTAGFSAVQGTELQDEVDRDLATLGGEQVAANSIITADGSTITYALPGQKYAHMLGDGLDGNDPRTPLYSCASGDFCGWLDADYTGKEFSYAACESYYEIPDGFDSGGSWIDNQTSGYTTSFYGKSHNYLSSTPSAYSAEPVANWHPVWYIRNNC